MKQSHFIDTPILIIFFNRPDCLKQLLLGLVNAGAKNIYFAADGPRMSSDTDVSKIEACREIAKSFSTCFESVRFLNSEENFGCHTFVPKAISWFFSMEEQGIILEDDCLIDNNFLRFADFALKKYYDVPEIMCISAANFQTHRVG